MLPTVHRLTSPEHFREAVRRGRRSGGPTVVVHLLVPTGGGLPQRPRAGFVVSKAVGNAVTRNLVKRRLRHLVAERLEQLPPQALLVVRALPASATAAYADLAHDLDRCLVKVAPVKGASPGPTGSVPVVAPA